MIRHIALAALLLLFSGARSPAAAPLPGKKAAGPVYRTIAPHGARPLRGYLRHPGQVEALPVEPYAWGWFGVAPRSHAGSHRGYYGDRWIIHRTGR